MRISLSKTAILFIWSLLFFSCQMETQTEGSPAELRERAASMRAHAVGLREDVRDKKHLINKNQSELETMRRNLEAIESEIAEIEPKVSELRQEQEESASYEAHLIRKTVSRWKTRLNTLQYRQDVALEQIRSLQQQIEQLESVAADYVVKADNMETEAAELDMLAEQRAQMPAEEEEDFWSKW